MADLTGLKSNLAMRARVIDAIRGFFRSEGFLEVETPVRVRTPAPESNIDAIPSDGWFLSTSPELYMKQMLAAGYERLVQITRCFRLGERGRLHNPEFTMLEWYRAGADYLEILADSERLVEQVCRQVGRWPVVRYQGLELDMRAPWKRMKVLDAFEAFAGWRPGSDPDPDRFDIDLVEKVEPAIGRQAPICLLDYPAAMASLARLKQGAEVAERLEVYAGGLELANAYSELNDPEEQRRRFIGENEKRRKAGKQVYPLPERFLSVVGRMPSAGGCALGIDRLVMLLCDAASIDEVVAFTSDTA